jgi:hypothetical protein
MSATIPWSPVQLWKRHRGATIVGFLPPVLLLILLTTQASISSLSDVIGEILSPPELSTTESRVRSRRSREQNVRGTVLRNRTVRGRFQVVTEPLTSR